MRDAKISLLYLTMGSSSLRQLRAGIQNMSLRHKLNSTSHTRVFTFNLFVCVVLFLYLRYNYWTDNVNYRNPGPYRITRNNSGYGAVTSTVAGGTAALFSSKLFVRLSGKYKQYSPRKWSSTKTTTEDGQAPSVDVNNDQQHSRDRSPWTTENEDERDVQFSEHPDVGRFQREWLRQRRHRMDWERLLRPCVDQMGWGAKKPGWSKQNRSNAAASTISFWDIRPAGEFSKLLIQSRTADGRSKTIGGDWWRVYLRGPFSLAATIFDHNNGSYEALFLVMEPGIYRVEITLDHSLCDGLRDPPRDWFIRGNAQGKYQKEGLLGPLDDYLLQDFSNGTGLEIRVISRRSNSTVEGKLDFTTQRHISCQKACHFLWDGFGRWVDNTWKPYLHHSHRWTAPGWMSSTGTFWSYGDSLALRLFWSVNSRALCGWLYAGCKASYNWIYPVGNEQVEKQRNDDLDFQGSRVIDTIREVLHNPTMDNQASVLLLNLGLHFPISLNFSAYQTFIHDVVDMLKERERTLMGNEVPKYRAKVIWKTSSAIHKEKSTKLNSTNWRFFTSQRVYLFSAFATSVMCRAGYDVIDVYPLTDSYPGGTQDYVHYPDHVFASVEQMLEKHKVDPDEFRKGRFKTCMD